MRRYHPGHTGPARLASLPTPFRPLALLFALLGAGCAGGGAGHGAPGPVSPGDAAPAAPATAPAVDAPAVLRPAEPPPPLLDDGDPAALATAVARSLDWLADLPADTLFDFGVRRVAAGSLRAGLAELGSYLAGDPTAAELAAWVGERFEVVESVGNEEGEVLFTGYYEPVIPGARERTERATVPVYGRPHDLVHVRLQDFDPDLPGRRLTGRVEDGQLVPYPTRREIREEGALEGRAPVIAWVEDRVDLFFVEVQGSGAIRFPDGTELGIGVAASNGRPYRSIGRLLIDEGRVPAEQMSMQAIRSYLERHPEEVPRVLSHNESFIFFRTRDTPPIGSLGVPVTAERSIATDYRIFPRGALAFIATTRPAVDAEGRVVEGEPFRRFMLNQDTGGAIRGPGRVDVFWGRGEEAAETAGRMQQTGRLFFLLPRETPPSPPSPPSSLSGDGSAGGADRPARQSGVPRGGAAAGPGNRAGWWPSEAAGEPAGVRVVVLSDLNSSYGSTTYEPEVGRTIERVVSDWRPDLVLLAGDVVAGQKPSLADAQVRAMWAAFDSVVAAPLRRAGIPFAFTPGNHDASGHPAHARDRRLAASYWARTEPGIRPLPGGRFPFHYAFVHDDVLFLSLDASTGGVVADSAQMAWIRRTLASDAVRAAGLRIAVGHVPLYPVAEGRNRPGEVQADADSLRAVLEAGGVRLIISGHDHAYYPARRGALDLLHAGALGQGPRPLLGAAEGAPEPARTVTLLELFPGRDAVAERTYRVAGDSLVYVDPGSLPAAIDGLNGRIHRRDPVPAPRAAGATVVSYNIHAGRDADGVPNLERVAAFVDSVGADVVLLQEVDRGTARSGGVDQLAELRRLTGMEGVFGKSLDYDGGEYGIALLSRWPIRESLVVPLRAEPPEARAAGSYEPRVALLARLDAPGGVLPVLNTHLGAGAGTYRRQEVTALLAAIHRETGRTGPALVGGDFNARPESDEIAAATLPLHDAFALCGSGDGDTFPADAPDRRIDYLLLRDVGCATAVVGRTTASDHRPLVVRLPLRTP